MPSRSLPWFTLSKQICSVHAEALSSECSQVFPVESKVKSIAFVSYYKNPICDWRECNYFIKNAVKVECPHRAAQQTTAAMNYSLRWDTNNRFNYRFFSYFIFVRYLYFQRESCNAFTLIKVNAKVLVKELSGVWKHLLQFASIRIFVRCLHIFDFCL